MKIGYKVVASKRHNAFEQSIYLSLALAHAEKSYSFSKAQMIEDRY